MGTKWTSVRNAEPPWSRAESAAVGGVFAATAAARSTIESRGRKACVYYNLSILSDIILVIGLNKYVVPKNCKYLYEKENPKIFSPGLILLLWYDAFLFAKKSISICAPLRILRFLHHVLQEMYQTTVNENDGSVQPYYEDRYLEIPPSPC